MLIIITDTTIRSDILKTKIHQNYSKNVKKYEVDLECCLYSLFSDRKHANYIRGSIQYNIMGKYETSFTYKKYKIYKCEWSFGDWYSCSISEIFKETPYKYSLRLYISKNILDNSSYLIVNKRDFHNNLRKKYGDDVILIGNKVYINLYDYDLKRLL